MPEMRPESRPLEGTQNMQGRQPLDVTGRRTHSALVWSVPRNGMPEPKPYVYHGEDAAREAQVAEYVTWARKKAAQRIREIDAYLSGEAS